MTLVTQGKKPFAVSVAAASVLHVACCMLHVAFCVGP